MFIESKDFREILSRPEIRVSCSGLARIQDDQGRYVLMTNRGVLRHSNLKTLTPIGGGIMLTAEGKLFAQDAFDVKSFERDLDMRFTMPGSKAGELMTWFQSRQGREIDPRREVEEELTQEFPHLLHPEMTRGTIAQLEGFHSYIAPSPIYGALTLYLTEVSAITLPDQALTRLLEHSETADEPWIHLVTASEIKSGFTNSGIEIGRISESLIYYGHGKRRIPTR